MYEISLVNALLRIEIILIPFNRIHSKRHAPKTIDCHRIFQCSPSMNDDKFAVKLIKFDNTSDEQILTMENSERKTLNKLWTISGIPGKRRDLTREREKMYGDCLCKYGMVLK